MTNQKHQIQCTLFELIRICTRSSWNGTSSEGWEIQTNQYFTTFIKSIRDTM